MDRFRYPAILIVLLVITSAPAAAEPVFTAARGPEPSVIPVMHNFGPGEPLSDDPGIRVHCRYNQNELTVSVQAPKVAGYRPEATTKRDGMQWNEDGLELFVRPRGGPLHHFIINTKGVVYDSRKDVGEQWDADLTTSSEIQRTSWTLTIRIPFSEIKGAQPEPDTEFAFNAAVRTHIEDRALTATAVPAQPPELANDKNYGTLRLGKAGERFVRTFSITPTVRQKQPHMSYTATLSDGGKKTGHVPVQDGRIQTTVRVADHFRLPLLFTNPFRPKFSIKRRGDNALVLKLERAKFLARIANRMRLLLDGREFGPFPIQDKTRLQIPADQLSRGDYEPTLHLLNGSESPSLTTTSQFRKISEKRLSFDLSTIDVSGYFPDVDDRFPRVDAARTQFRLRDSGFPDRLNVDEWSLLRDPIRLLQGNRAVDFQVRKTESHQNVVRFQGNQGQKTLNGRIAFDGFAWFDVETPLDGQESARVEIPLQFPENNKIFLSSSKSRWSHKLDDGTTFHSRARYLQITDGIRGITLYMPPDAAGLNIKNYDRMVRVDRQDNHVTLSMRVSDGRRTPRDGRLTFGFGIQPMPFREYDQRANFKYRIARAAGYDQRKSVRPELIKYYKQGGTEYLVHHQHWNTIQSYYTILERKKIFRELLADYHEAGIGYIPYFGFQISEKAPEFDLYYPHIGRGREVRPYVASHVPPAKSYPVCYGTLWGDHWIRGLKKFLQTYPVDGIYMDGTLRPIRCENESHGHRVTDRRGRVVPYFTTLEMRRFALLLHEHTRTVRPDLVWDVHHSNPLCGATESLADVVWNGEQTHKYSDDWKVPVGVYRAQFNSRLYGIPIQHLSNLGYKHIERDLGVTLLFDAMQRPMEGVSPWSRTAFKLWAIFDEYDLGGTYFVPYYENEKFTDQTGDALVSYYRTPEHLVLVVSNYANEAETQTTLELEGEPWADANTAKDIWNKEQFRVVSGRLNFSIPPEGFRLIRIPR